MHSGNGERARAQHNQILPLCLERPVSRNALAAHAISCVKPASGACRFADVQGECANLVEKTEETWARMWVAIRPDTPPIPLSPIHGHTERCQDLQE